jgi:hypothetical protein
MNLPPRTSAIVKFMTVLITLCALGSLPGCAADATPEDYASESEDDVTATSMSSNLLGRVAAVRVRGTFMASAYKVSDVLRATGLSPRADLPKPGPLPSGSSPYTVEYFDAKGEALAVAGLFCDPCTEGVHPGYLRVGSSTYAIRGDVGLLEKQAKSARTMTDMLFGVDRIEFARPRSGKNGQTTDPKKIRLTLKAIGDVRSRIDPRHLQECSVRTLTFYRAGTNLGTLSTGCHQPLFGNTFLAGDSQAYEIELDEIAMRGAEYDVGSYD